jgi:hypothetical protein
MNPFSEILPGLIAGQQRKAMQPREEPEAIMPDPGEYQPVTPDAVLGDVKQDINKIYAIDQRLKTLPVSSDNRKRLLQNYVNKGVVKSDIVKTLANKGTKPEDIERMMSEISNGSEYAQGNIDAILEISGNDPKVKAAIDSKIAQFNKLNQDNLQKRFVVLAKTIGNIDEFMENPKEWSAKNGKINSEVLQIVRNEPKYLEEMASINPEWVKNYLSQKQARRTGGGSPVDYSAIGQETGQMYTERLYDPNQMKKLHPDAGDVMHTPRMGENEQLETQLNIARKKYQNEIKGLPDAPEGGGKPDDKTKLLFINRAKDPTTGKVNKNKLIKMFKDKGWDVEE